MMDYIQDLAALEALYPEPPADRSLKKVVPQLTPMYCKWIMASRFCVLSTVGPEGTDASPRGDDGPVVAELGAHTLALPDWSGNNRIDSLRNLVRDPRLSLMFMVPGSQNVVCVNGTGRITADPALLQSFERKGRLPRSAIVVEIAEIYFQCAKALIRSGLWSRGDESKTVPTAGDFVKEVDAGFDGEAYDRTYPEYAKPRLW